ncbi:hypothetical protein ACERK3_03550 [Phycisphaerales bacterium AB-hyl4]|uniref:Type IV pilus biogenesis protein PilP n=1 Tax=Natronomicrosphaera hydrolytica TaxID=3242702 RepID=A0ABV4U1F2_9BACT
MQMNKQQKILAAVLGTGLLALGVDRLVLDTSSTGPQAASAGATAAVERAGAESMRSDAVDLAREALDEARAEPKASLAQRLSEASQQHDLSAEPGRDAFAPSESWMSDITPAREVEPKGDADARRFRQEHRLMAVMTPGDRGVVVVNGQALRVGQRVNGFLLIDVQRHSATFHGPGGQVELKLDP